MPGSSWSRTPTSISRRESAGEGGRGSMILMELGPGSGTVPLLLAAHHYRCPSCRSSLSKAQEGRLFKPLAFTKTYAMAGAALLSITSFPPTDGLARARPHRSARTDRNPVELALSALRVLPPPELRPCAGSSLGSVLSSDLPVALVTGTRSAPKLGSGVHATLWTKGTCSTCRRLFRGVSITKARELLQQTDRIIREASRKSSACSGRSGAPRRRPTRRRSR